MVKDYSFSNDDAEILIVDTVKANAIKSVIFNEKASYRIVKTDNVSDATVSFPDIQEETPEDITTEDGIILDEIDETRGILGHLNKGNCDKHHNKWTRSKWCINTHWEEI